MHMFSKKRFVIFISKQFIDPGFVTLGETPLFEGGEAFSYTKETLAESLKKIKEISKGKIRIVLGEELVYVAELSFPNKTIITRELVQKKTEEIIPEDLKQTEWDFQALQYKEKSKDTREIVVQVAVIEKSFSDSFRQALITNPLPIESIYPESYVLANLESGATGVSVIIEQDRGLSVLCAVEDGFSIASRVQKEAVMIEDVKVFIDFLLSYKGKKIERIIFSHFSEEVMTPFLNLADEGYTVLAKDYNPLVGAALQEKISGKDEDILNIDIFSLAEKKVWWKIW